MIEAKTAAAFLSTTLISLAPNVLLFLFPDYKPSSAALNPLAIGQALAAGGLLGDVFLHTLPHEMNHENGEMIGLAILAGFTVFFMFDIIVRSNSHNHCTHANPNHGETNKKNEEFFFNSTVILNLAADSLHNFTDGIAIGASFATVTNDGISSLSFPQQVQHLLQSRGGLASLAVLFHEIPHELGDYSILVSSGMTKKQAIMAQFSTAIAAYLGTFVGLFGMQSLKAYTGTDLMIPFTAGGFIYVATITILPGLLEEKADKKARFVQILAFLVGIAFMYGVAVLEHMGGGHGHDHSHSHGHGHDHHMHEHHDHHMHDHHEHHHDHSEL